MSDKGKELEKALEKRETAFYEKTEKQFNKRLQKTRMEMKNKMRKGVLVFIICMSSIVTLAVDNREKIKSNLVGLNENADIILQLTGNMTKTGFSGNVVETIIIVTAYHYMVYMCILYRVASSISIGLLCLGCVYYLH